MKWVLTHVNKMSNVDAVAIAIERYIKGHQNTKNGGVLEVESRFYSTKNGYRSSTYAPHYVNIENFMKTSGFPSTTKHIYSVGFHNYTIRFRAERGSPSYLIEDKIALPPVEDELSWMRFGFSSEMPMKRVYFDGEYTPEIINEDEDQEASTFSINPRRRKLIDYTVPKISFEERKLSAPEQSPAKTVTHLTREITDEEWEARMNIIRNDAKLHKGPFRTNLVERYIERTSYTIRGKYLVELSKVKVEGNIHYEVEVELLQPEQSLSSIPEYILICRKLMARFRGTDIFYDKFVYENFCALVNMNCMTTASEDAQSQVAVFGVSKKIFNQVRTVKKGDLVTEGIVLNKNAVYGAALKTDGYAMALVFCCLGVWLFRPPYTYNLIERTNIFPDREITILDGESIPVEHRNFEDDKKVKYIFECFGAIRIQGFDVRRANLVERQSIAQRYVNSIFLEGDFRNKLEVCFKKVRSFRSPEEFFEVNKLMLALPRRFTTDGLIYTPINLPYWISVDVDTASPSRTVKTDPEILKWKNPLDTTIDFRHVVIKDVDYLYVSDWNAEAAAVPTNERSVFVPKEAAFLGNEMYPLNQRTQVDWEQVRRESIPGSIGEYAFKDGKFFYVRDRNEKDSPNSILTATANWSEINMPITEKAIAGENFQLMFFYHGALKGEMMNKGHKTLLDIGSGKGGVLKYFYQYDRIIAAEPNKEHRIEFVRRCGLQGLEVYSLEDPLPETGRFVLLINAKAQDTSIIKKAVERVSPGGVNLVSLMDVGTFLWESPEILKSSIETIQSCLAPGGKFVWKMMNGDLVRHVIPKSSKKKSGEYHLKYGSFDLKYTTNKGDIESRVEVLIPEGITTEGDAEEGYQTEYLTSVDEMLAMFPSPEYTVDSRNICNEEEFMPPASKNLSALFEYGVISKAALIKTTKVPGRPLSSKTPKTMSSIQSRLFGSGSGALSKTGTTTARTSRIVTAAPKKKSEEIFDL